MLSLSKAASSTIFESFLWLDLALNPSPLTIGEHSLGQYYDNEYIYISFYIYI